jgi:uncharacterized repeat protein (TIGR02543 family)
MKKNKTIKLCVLLLSIILLSGLVACNPSRSFEQSTNANSLEKFLISVLGIQNSEGVYDVDFFTGGGKNVRSMRTSVIEKEPETTLSYYDFGGWYENSDYSGERIKFPYTVTRNMTLYAKWYKQYSVSFETNGGKELDSIRAGYIEKTPVTTRAGFNFEGWFTTPGFDEGTLVSFPFEVTQDYMFYAKWVTAGAYEIRTAEQLLNIRYGLDAANVYTLANDMDFNTPTGKMEIEPIGTLDLPFEGTFNGNGKIISNFSITETDDFEKYYGLFGAISGANIRNLTIKDAYIKLDSNYMFYAGGITGYMEGGTINNCTVQNADFIGDGKEVHLGAIAGYLDGGTITNSASVGGFIRSRSAEQEINVGGIVGYIKTGTVSNCYGTSYVSGRIAGGIAGSNNGTIRDCYFDGSAEQPLSYTTVVKNTPITEYTTIAGGIAGNNYAGGLITECRTNATVNAKWAGGIAGINGSKKASGTQARITHSFSTSNVNSTYIAGGIAGHNEKAVISNCFNRGIVRAEAVPVKLGEGQFKGGSTSNIFAGGIAGYNLEGVIDRCLNYNSINAKSIQPNVDGSRPQVGDYNPAYAGSIVGFSMVSINTCYSLQGLTVTRNDTPYTLNEDNIFYRVETRQNETLVIVPDNEYTAVLFFRTVLGYQQSIWSLHIDGTSITLSFA